MLFVLLKVVAMVEREVGGKNRQPILTNISAALFSAASHDVEKGVRKHVCQALGIHRVQTVTFLIKTVLRQCSVCISIDSFCRSFLEIQKARKTNA